MRQQENLKYVYKTDFQVAMTAFNLLENHVIKTYTHDIVLIVQKST